MCHAAKNTYAIADLNLERFLARRGRQIIEHADQIKIARLKKGIYSKRKTFESKKTITSYLLKTRLKSTIDKTSKLIHALTQRYDEGLMRRCAIRDLVGLRFSKASDRIEISVSFPGHLAIWSMKQNGKITTWSATINRDSAEFIYRLAQKVTSK